MNNSLTAFVFALATTITATTSTLAHAADQASAAVYSTADSSVGELLDNPQAKAILDKYLPGFSAAPQIDLARGMTLKSVQAFAPDTVTDDALVKIDADLAKLKPGK